MKTQWRLQIGDERSHSWNFLEPNCNSGSWTFQRLILVPFGSQSEVWINVHNMLKPLENGRFLWASERSGFRRTTRRNHWPDLQNNPYDMLQPLKLKECVGWGKYRNTMERSWLMPQLIVPFCAFLLFLLAYRITLACKPMVCRAAATALEIQVPHPHPPAIPSCTMVRLWGTFTFMDLMLRERRR